MRLLLFCKHKQNNVMTVFNVYITRHAFVNSVHNLKILLVQQGE